MKKWKSVVDTIVVVLWAIGIVGPVTLILTRFRYVELNYFVGIIIILINLGYFILNYKQLIKK